MTTSLRTPAVLGKPVVDPAIWVGEELQGNQSWLYELGSEEINGLLAMARNVRPLIGDDPSRLLALDKSHFNLGVFQHTLASIWRQLRDGMGVALIRGLPLGDMEPIEAASVYWGSSIRRSRMTRSRTSGTWGRPPGCRWPWSRAGISPPGPCRS